MTSKPIGVVGLRDMLTLELPDFVSFVADVDFVHDFGAVEDTRPSVKTLNKTVASLMKPVFTVEEDCGLLRAYALMLHAQFARSACRFERGKTCRDHITRRHRRRYPVHLAKDGKMTVIPAILSTTIFFGSLILIFSEKLHRFWVDSKSEKHSLSRM